MPDQGRDRLRELLDAVLDDEHRTLGEMAEGAYSSPFHFSRRLARGTGEPPVTMRRRVLLERARRVDRADDGAPGGDQGGLAGRDRGPHPPRRRSRRPRRTRGPARGRGRRWLATVRDIDRRGAWGDRLIDALCEPRESFVLGGVLAHVLTYSAHRRQLARLMLRDAGAAPDDGDPLDWLRRRSGGLA